MTHVQAEMVAVDIFRALGPFGPKCGTRFLQLPGGHVTPRKEAVSQSGGGGSHSSRPLDRAFECENQGGIVPPRTGRWQDEGRISGCAMRRAMMVLALVVGSVSGAGAHPHVFVDSGVEVIAFEPSAQLFALQATLMQLAREETPEQGNVGALFADEIVLRCE